MNIQLPNDAEAVGYRKTGPFQHEQVFRSASNGFEGTEREFVESGHAYAYVQLDAFTRREVKL